MPYCKVKRGGRPLFAAASNARTHFFPTSVGDKKLTILIKQYLHKKIKKSNKSLPFSSIAAAQLQTLSIKVSKLIFILLAFAFAASTAYADVYRCVVNGKTVYSDARCAYNPGVVRIDPNQNVVQGERSSVNNDSRVSAKCAELLDRLSRVRSYGDLDKYSTLYEFQCMTPSDREASAQRRSNRKTQRQLDDVRNTQNVMQNRQMMHELYP